MVVISCENCHSAHGDVSPVGERSRNNLANVIVVSRLAGVVETPSRAGDSKQFYITRSEHLPVKVYRLIKSTERGHSQDVCCKPRNHGAFYNVLSQRSLERCIRLCFENDQLLPHVSRPRFLDSLTGLTLCSFEGIYNT